MTSHSRLHHSHSFDKRVQEGGGVRMWGGACGSKREMLETVTRFKAITELQEMHFHSEKNGAQIVQFRKWWVIVLLF